jgi:hypothetical protein
MKPQLIAALVCSYSLCNAAPIQMTGTWEQKQQIESQHIDKDWQFIHGEQSITITAPPAPFTPPISDSWLDVALRHHPAGIMRKLAWSPSESTQATLLANINVSAIGEVIPGWHWEKNFYLARNQQRVKLRTGKVTKLNGWCILISDYRPAQASQDGIANETETRFDWWAQYNPKLCK